ncbi:MAG: hypothetical protein ACRDIY_01190 [Chloroflexota bacterium]
MSVAVDTNVPIDLLAGQERVAQPARDVLDGARQAADRPVG